MSNTLTLIFGFRNREITRVKRCLDSLKNQSVKEFNVIFIDYGSNEYLSKEVEKLIDQYPFCRYIFNNTRGKVWNRSHALNTGIKRAESEYILTTDIDLIYSKDFIKKILERLSPDIELHSSAFSLSQSFKQWKKLQTDKTIRFKTRDQSALGLVQGVSNQLHQEINGFDEYFRIWGEEDLDLKNRIAQKGVNTEWLKLTETPVYHQWHPKSGVRNRSNIPKGWQKHMNQYRLDNSEVVKRNSLNDWGEIILTENRKVISLPNIPKIHLSGIPSLAIQNELDNFLNSNNEKAKHFIFQDDNYHHLKKSRLVNWLSRFNNLSNKFNWPILLVNDMEYFGNVSNTYDYTDVIMYYLLRNGNSIADYYYEKFEDRVELKVVKK